MERSPRRPADHRLLDSPVLVAQGDLEVEDFLAVALEAEMAGLDDAGVDRADRDLVHLLALDAVEVADARSDRRARLARCAQASRPVPERDVAQRLEPGVADRLYSVLLRDLALEGLGLRTERRQRRIVVALNRRPRRREAVSLVVGEDGEELGPRDARGPGARTSRRSRSRCDALHDEAGELFDRQDGDRVEAEGPAERQRLQAGAPAVIRGPQVSRARPRSERRAGRGCKGRGGGRCPSVPGRARR